MQWYIGVWKKFAQFTGRARRKEFWMFALGNFIIAILIGIVESALGLATTTTGAGSASFNGGPLSAIFALATIIPSIAVGTRRLHDIGKSGWLQLLVFVPFVGLILIYWFLKDGEPADNRFGANPKAALLTA